VKIFLLALALTAAAAAQSRTCDLNAITDGVPPVYPPIARVAHVTGMVIMIATFERSGDVQQIKVISGPQLLRQPAIEYVKSWRASEYGGIRNCPVVVNYILNQKDTQPSLLVRLDPQHVNVYGEVLCLCDPSPVIGVRKKRFWFF
jgi:hypothetical protein